MEKYIPLNELLLEDNEETKKIKTLRQREEEYSYLLGNIEHIIALHYFKNRKLKDKHVVKMLKNLKINYHKDLESFNESLEKKILIQLNFALQERKTTHHELSLAFSYILWCIDNRAWIGENRAYLDWLLNFFGMTTTEEKKEFKEKYHKIGEEFGIDGKKIDIMTAEGGNLEDLDTDAQINKDDEVWLLEDSKYFAMSDEEKCEYLLRCKDKIGSSRALIDLLEQMDIYFKSKKFANIVKIADKIKDANIEKYMREIIYSMKAEALICMQEYKEAEKAANDLIEFSKDYPMGYFHIALIKYHNNDLVGALETLDKTIETAEKSEMHHPQYYRLKAEVLKKMGKDDYKEFEKKAAEYEKKGMELLKEKAKELGVEEVDFEELKGEIEQERKQEMEQEEEQIEKQKEITPEEREERKNTSEGECKYCNEMFSYKAIARHLKTCKERAKDISEDHGDGKVFLIKAGIGPYFVYFEVNASEKLTGVDTFLRNLWLECCGHMSMFTIKNEEYISVPEKGEKNMEISLNKVINVGASFSHEYDFGTTTYLELKCIAERKGKLNEIFEIISRNEPLDFKCKCGKKAEEMCTECVDMDEESAFLCSDCVKKHEHDEEMFLPVVNSPRMGMCGYTGD